LQGRNEWSVEAVGRESAEKGDANACQAERYASDIEVAVR